MQCFEQHQGCEWPMDEPFCDFYSGMPTKIMATYNNELTWIPLRLLSIITVKMYVVTVEGQRGESEQGSWTRRELERKVRWWQIAHCGCTPT